MYALFLAGSYHLSSPSNYTHIQTLNLIYRLRLAGAALIYGRLPKRLPKDGDGV